MIFVTASVQSILIPTTYNMTQSAVVYTTLKNSHDAGADLGIKIQNIFGTTTPHVIIVFASSVYQYETLLSALKGICKPEILVGSSSAGEFTSTDFGTESACAIGLYNNEMKFSAALSQGIKEDRQHIAEELSAGLTGLNDLQYQYHSAMLFADALSGYTDELIELLTEKTLGDYQFFGGGAGDNENFNRTHVFYDCKAYTDSVIILEILSDKPVGIGVAHGWKPTGNKMRVTQTEGTKLISLNSRPAVELFKEHAASQDRQLDLEQPIPFFLHNILGIEIAGDFKLRVPLGINPDGSINMASDIPKGAYVSFMTTSNDCSWNAAREATQNALSQLEHHKPSVALFFDCVATRLRMGDEFNSHLNLVNNTLDGIKYAGCNTYGQIARVDGQFSGFQNCTAVVCVIPE
jgi:hypothetical protein